MNERFSRLWLQNAWKKRPLKVAKDFYKRGLFCSAVGNIYKSNKDSSTNETALCRGMDQSHRWTWLSPKPRMWVQVHLYELALPSVLPQFSRYTTPGKVSTVLWLIIWLFPPCRWENGPNRTEKADINSRESNFQSKSPIGSRIPILPSALS